MKMLSLISVHSSCQNSPNNSTSVIDKHCYGYIRVDIINYGLAFKDRMILKSQAVIVDLVQFSYKFVMNPEGN